MKGVKREWERKIDAQQNQNFNLKNSNALLEKKL
jgi:hypothetical protein